MLEKTRGLTGINPNHVGSAYALAAIPARIAFERGMWKDAMQLEPRSSKFPYADAITHFARALGAAPAATLPPPRRECRNWRGSAMR